MYVIFAVPDMTYVNSFIVCVLFSSFTYQLSKYN